MQISLKTRPSLTPPINKRSMVKILSPQELQKRKTTLWAIEDYFGERISNEQFDRILKRIQGKDIELTVDEDIKAAWCIKTNLGDKEYVKSLEYDR